MLGQPVRCQPLLYADVNSPMSQLSVADDVRSVFKFVLLTFTFRWHLNYVRTEVKPQATLCSDEVKLHRALGTLDADLEQ